MSSAFLFAQDNTNSGGSLLSFIVLPALLLGMYFLLIRPQRRRVKEQEALQQALTKGDEVITTSGIYGFISAVEDSYFWLEIDDDVQVRIAKAAIQGKVPTPVDDDDSVTSESAKSDKDAS